MRLHHDCHVNRDQVVLDMMPAHEMASLHLAKLPHSNIMAINIEGRECGAFTVLLSCRPHPYVLLFAALEDFSFIPYFTHTFHSLSSFPSKVASWIQYQAVLATSRSIHKVSSSDFLSS